MNETCAVPINIEGSVREDSKDKNRLLKFNNYYLNNFNPDNKPYISLVL